jgi:uncharacterized protein DUF3540
MGAPELSLHTSDLSDCVAVHALAVNFVAEVETVADGGACRVRAGAQRFNAQPAYSCLVVPAAGDRVACWRGALPEGGDAVHILAVLSRADAAAPMRLQLAADAELKAGRLAIDAGTLDVRADEASLVYRSLKTLGEWAQCTIGQLRLVGASLATVFDHESHHARQHQRTVDGIDLLQAQTVDHRAESLMHLQGENVLANGDRLVKVQGAQIHFG